MFSCRRCGEKVIDTLKERAQETYNNGVKGAMIVIRNSREPIPWTYPRKWRKRCRVCRKFAERCQTGNDCRYVGQYSEHHRQPCGNGDVCAIVCSIGCFPFLGKVEGYADYLYHYSAFADCLFHLSGNYRKLDQHHFAFFAFHCYPGMVVDDAIVVLENVTTHIERGSDPKQAAIHGTNEVAISIVASTLTMIAVFFPMTMVGGMTGVLLNSWAG